MISHNIAYLTIAILTAACCSACAFSDADTIKKINCYIDETLPEGRMDSVFFLTVIPEQGCGTCITQAEQFYKDFSSRDDMMFVFCNIMSNKILKNKVTINPDNTILDYDNKLLSLLPQNKRIYPCVFVIKDGKASALIWQSKNESAFMTVRKFLNN
jgi:hypothetical protein